MALYLIVANQTIGGDELTATLDELVGLVGADSCTFRFLVPVTDTEGTQQWDYPPIDRAIPDAHRIARALAEGRLEHELARLKRSGFTASGDVVDAQPVDRVQQLLHEEPFDGVVVSTLPRRLSRWLRMDLPHRIARVSGDVPVTHIEGNAGPSL